MSVTQKITKPGQIPCGFCSTGHHELCTVGVLNGDGRTVVRCICTECTPAAKCLQCGKIDTIGTEVSADTWSCIDLDGCQATTRARAEETQKRLYGDSDDRVATRTPEKRERARTTPRKAGGTCLCCAEPTKGGMFLPGHDSKYLSRTVEAITGGVVSLDATLDAWAKRGVSEALQGKLTKRVS